MNDKEKPDASTDGIFRGEHEHWFHIIGIGILILLTLYLTVMLVADWIN